MVLQDNPTQITPVPFRNMASSLLIRITHDNWHFPWYFEALPIFLGKVGQYRVKIMGSGEGLLGSNCNSASYEICTLFLLLFYEIVKSDQGNGSFTPK